MYIAFIYIRMQQHTDVTKFKMFQNTFILNTLESNTFPVHNAHQTQHIIHSGNVNLIN